MSYELTKLGPYAFEHLVNQLCLAVLGAGHTSFGPGSDGGRDGYFEGAAPYPSEKDHWSGRWYIQCKYHAPHLSADPQKWLLSQIESEIEQFQNESGRRVWPDIWIVATNIDPSGVPSTGSFDRARSMVKKIRPKLASRFHIWGGKKILDLLAQYPDVASSYRHFLTPGNVIAEILDQIGESRASAERALRYFLVTEFEEQLHTRLEQAGSSGDSRPGIHQLFVDVPFRSSDHCDGMTMENLLRATSCSHRPEYRAPLGKFWSEWSKQPSRARTWVLKGGPGRGKSTLGQYFSQIQRAALIVQQNAIPLRPGMREQMEDLLATAKRQGFLPSVPRVPIQIDLKDYAAWLGKRSEADPKGVTTFISARVSKALEQSFTTGAMLKLLASRSWFIAFDGLDEVPEDVKDLMAVEIRHFLENVAIEQRCDIFALCTSRPQGYSGQFSRLDAATVDLVNLTNEQALACARPILELDRPPAESRESFKRLREAMDSPAVMQLMTTPLQSHIMAIIVRDGGRPPERRWQLFTTFYQVIKRREANKNFPDPKLLKLLREDDRLLKTIHNRVGFVLHARSEKSDGATASLPRGEFEKLAREAVQQLHETDIEETVAVLVRAATERLVLISTPEAGSKVSFDVRQLQEFFAAEFIYEAVTIDTLRLRLETISGDSHWREVVQFCLSALIECDRTTETHMAASVLFELNNGLISSHEFRTLNYRLCKGAHIVAHLLAEGVLEADRRTRSIMGNALTPLFAAPWYPDAEVLAETKQPNSRFWLIDTLFKSLQERNFSENISASSALAHLLDDDSPRLPQLVSYLRSAPIDHVTLVLINRSMSSHRKVLRNKEQDRTKWYRLLILEVLKRPDWYKGCYSQNFWIFETILSDQTSANSLFRDAGYGPSEVWAIKCWANSTPAGRRKSNKANSVNTWAEYYNYSRRKLLENFPKDPILFTGFFELSSVVLEFLKTPSPESVKKMANVIASSPDLLESWRGGGFFDLIPLSAEYALEPQLENLKNADESALDLLLSSSALGGIAICGPQSDEYVHGLVIDSPEWSVALRVRPLLCASVLARRLFSADSKGSSRERAVLLDHVMALWKARPDIALRQFDLIGAVLELAPARMEEVVSVAKSVANCSPRLLWSRGELQEGALYIRYGRGFFIARDFVSGMCAHVATSIASGLLHAEYYGHGALEAQGVKDLLARVKIYFPDVNCLRDVANNFAELKDRRIFAALLAVIHSDADSSGTDHSRACDILESSDLAILPSWMYFVFAKLLKAAPLHNVQEVERIASQLLTSAGGDYLRRSVLSPVVTMFREKSRAPVTERGLVTEWLSDPI